MTFWDVHLALRDHKGRSRQEFIGAFTVDDLSAGLEVAMQRAKQEGGGVQVTRQRPTFGRGGSGR